MNCHETKELLGAYGDSELNAVQNLQIEKHLEQCPAPFALYQRVRL